MSNGETISGLAAQVEALRKVAIAMTHVRLLHASPDERRAAERMLQDMQASDPSDTVKATAQAFLRDFPA